MGEAWREQLARRSAVAGDRPRARAQREEPALRAAFDEFVRRHAQPGYAAAPAFQAWAPPSRGGSTTTRCSARCTPASTTARGPSGRGRCASATRWRSAAARVELGRRDALPEVAAVGSPTRSGTTRRRRRGPCRSWATSPSWWTATAPTSGRTPSRSELERLGRRAARRLQHRRAELGHAGLPVGPAGGRRTSRGFAPGPAARQRCSTATGSITSSASTEPTCSPRRFPRALHAGRPDAQLALGETVLSIFGQPAPHHRRGSRHGARLRARVAPAPGRARLQGVPLGTRLGDEGSRTATRRISGGVGGDLRHARHRDPAAWWDGLDAAERAAVLATPAWRRRAAAWPNRPARSRPRSATCSSRCCSRPAPTSFCCPSRTSSAGATASTFRRIGRQNWTWRLPWPVDRLASEPKKRRSAAPRCGAGARRTQGRRIRPTR